jgi:hypothetical protein
VLFTYHFKKLTIKFHFCKGLKKFPIIIFNLKTFEDQGMVSNYLFIFYRPISKMPFFINLKIVNYQKAKSNIGNYIMKMHVPNNVGNNANANGGYFN